MLGLRRKDWILRPAGLPGNPRLRDSRRHRARVHARPRLPARTFEERPGQVRPDTHPEHREGWVGVLTRLYNVICMVHVSDMKTNFEKYTDSKNFVIYDYNSVMHYSQFAFSKKYYLPSIKVNWNVNSKKKHWSISKLLYILMYINGVV